MYRAEPTVAKWVAVRTLLVTLGLVFAFVSIGVLISCSARNAERATVMALLVWLAGALLHDFALIGMLLRFRLSPQVVFGLAALNPVEAARLAILSGLDPELSVFGPVGFWLANAFGLGQLLAVGVGGPLLLGAVVLAVAGRKFRHADLVG